MKIGVAVEALAALAQESRLSIFRLLVQAGKEGLAAGVLGERLGIPAATLSFHLKTLAHAQLVKPRTEGCAAFVYIAMAQTVRKCSALPSLRSGRDDGRNDPVS